MTRVGRCSICSHAEVDAIERDLVAGGISLRKIAAAYGLNHMSVSGHQKNHMSEALIAVAKQEKRERAQSLLERIERLVADVEDVMHAAKRKGNATLVLQSADRLEKILRLMGSATGELRGDGTTIQVLNIQQDPSWLRIRSAILTTLVRFPEAKLAVAEAIRASEATGEPHRPQQLPMGVVLPIGTGGPLGRPVASVGETGDEPMGDGWTDDPEGEV